MRNLKNLFPMTLLGAVVLFSSACGDRPKPEDDLGAVSEDRAAAETANVPEAASEMPRDHELRPDVVTIEEEGQAGAQADLDARERRLAERQAELEAREERLRDREAGRREAERQTARRAPAPAPRPAPVPEPEVRAESPEPEPVPEYAEPEEPAETERAAERATVSAGTEIGVTLSEPLSSATSAVGDTFRARVASDVVEDGEVVIPRGSELVGEVTQAVASRRIGGQAKLGLRFTDLVLPSGSTVPIDATLEQIGRSQTGKDAATIGGAAAGGAILGRVLSNRDRSRGAVLGAIIGAAAGAAAASRNAADEVVIPEGTPIHLSLDREIEVPLRR